MADDIKRMNISEFHELGFLQEANRLFFHPHGLALEIYIDDVTREKTLGGIWDYRDDPEGMVFADTSGEVFAKKVDQVQAEWERHREARKNLFGHHGGYDEWTGIQPVGTKVAPTPKTFEED